MVISRLPRFPFLLLALLGLVSCSGESGKFVEAIEQGKLQIESLTIESLRTASQRGEQLSYRAQANLANQDPIDFSSKVRWRTDDPAVASIDGSGKVTTLASGTVQVIAEYADKFTSSELVVNDAALVGLGLTSDITLDVCRGAQLGATGTYSDGSRREIRDLVSWSVNDGSNATITDVGAEKGFIVATEAKEVTVTMTKDSDSKSSPLTVQNSLSAIDVSAPATEIEVGNQQQYSAMGSYSGTEVDITNNVIWGSNDTAVATIDSQGLLTTVSSGNTDIVASCGGEKPVTVALTVTDASKDRLQFVFDSGVVTALPRTDTSDFELTLQTLTSNGATIDRTESATWSVQNLVGIQTVIVSNETDSKGQVTNITGSGSFTVKAEYDGSAVLLLVEVDP